MQKIPWTADQTELLIRLWCKGVPMAQIEVATGHGEHSVRNKVNVLRSCGEPLLRPRRIDPEHALVEEGSLMVPGDDPLLARLVKYHL